MIRPDTSAIFSRFCAPATVIAVVALVLGLVVALDSIAELRCAALEPTAEMSAACAVRAEVPPSATSITPAGWGL